MTWFTFYPSILCFGLSLSHLTIDTHIHIYICGCFRTTNISLTGGSPGITCEETVITIIIIIIIIIRYVYWQTRPVCACEKNYSCVSLWVKQNTEQPDVLPVWRIEVFKVESWKTSDPRVTETRVTFTVAVQLGTERFLIQRGSEEWGSAAAAGTEWGVELHETWITWKLCQV